MQQFSGIKMVITEVSVIFEKHSATLTLYSPLIANGAQLIVTCVAAFILSRFGRKKPTLIGNFSLSIINFILAILFLVNYKTGSVEVIYAACICLHHIIHDWICSQYRPSGVAVCP